MTELHNQGIEPQVGTPGISPEAVRAKLRDIIASRHFRSSKRSQQFLEYVVEQKLSGNESSIKERLIGIEVFGRNSNYATGDDPVVRVQAGEVRRRLERYQADSHDEGSILMELPTGTYVPVFRIRQTERTTEEPAANPRGTHESVADTPVESFGIAADVLRASAFTIPLATSQRLSISSESKVTAKPAWSAKFFIFSLFMLLIGGFLGYAIHAPQHASKAVTEFWGPVLSSPKPIIINLGKPFVYTPSTRLFDGYERDHPGTFEKGVDRHNQRLPLDESTSIKWSDMTPVSNSGPAVGGVRAGLILTSFLGRFGKPFKVRFGDEGSFLELRDSPSVIVGAMNNRWTTDIDNDFHFGIRDNNSYQYIQEAGTNRIWRTEYTDRGAKDYGLITREPVGTTGQFLLKIAGLQDGGTEAACELVTNPEMLQGAIRTLPPHWESKNLQIIVATEMIGRTAGPPQVIAVHVW